MRRLRWVFGGLALLAMAMLVVGSSGPVRLCQLGIGCIATAVDTQTIVVPDVSNPPAGVRKIAVARLEVSYADWQRCYADGGCKVLPKATFTGDPAAFPVIGVSWLDIRDYLSWLERRTGLGYRLPSLDEWLWIARDVPQPEQRLLFTDPRLAWAANYGSAARISAVLRPQGSFSHSVDGIGDLDGNVWEWTDDCAAEGFDGDRYDRCPAFYLGGRHIAAMSVLVRDPANGGCTSGTPPANLGFRLVRDL